MIYGPRRTDGMPLVLRFELTGMAMNSISSAELIAMIYFERTENLGLVFKGYDLVTKSIYTPYFAEDDHATWRNPEFMILETKDVVEVELGRYLDSVQAVLEKRPLTCDRVDA